MLKRRREVLETTLCIRPDETHEWEGTPVEYEPNDVQQLAKLGDWLIIFHDDDCIVTTYTNRTLYLSSHHYTILRRLAGCRRLSIQGYSPRPLEKKKEEVGQEGANVSIR